MSNELKPCPFCGGIAEYEAVNKKWLVECQVCVISTSVPMHGKKAAAVYLNTKTKYLPYGFLPQTIGKTKLFVAPSTSGSARRFWDENYWFNLKQIIN